MPSQDSGALGRWCRLTCRLRLFPGLTAPLTASGQDCLSRQTSWAVVLIWKVSLVSLVNRNRLEATQKVRQGFTGGPAASGSGPFAPHPLGWGAVPPVGWGGGVRACAGSGGLPAPSVLCAGGLLSALLLLPASSEVAVEFFGPLVSFVQNLSQLFMQAVIFLAFRVSLYLLLEETSVQAPGLQLRVPGPSLSQPAQAGLGAVRAWALNF